MPEVSKERTNWRDSALSERHRSWGYNCPVIDLDFVMLEYDKGKATAIVEYKNEHAQTQYSSHPSYRALVDLGNKADLPVFACRYASDFSWWRVVQLNAAARRYVKAPTEVDELEWVSILYKTRGREITAEEKKAIAEKVSW